MRRDDFDKKGTQIYSKEVFSISSSFVLLLDIMTTSPGMKYRRSCDSTGDEEGFKRHPLHPLRTRTCKRNGHSVARREKEERRT